MNRKFSIFNRAFHAQGSRLGPILFILYVAGLFKIIDKHLPNAHTYIAKININEITVGESTIESVEAVQSLGMWFDSRMSMDIHIGKVCYKAFRSLYNIRQIRKFLSEDTTKIFCSCFCYFTP